MHSYCGPLPLVLCVPYASIILLVARDATCVHFHTTFGLETLFRLAIYLHLFISFIANAPLDCFHSCWSGRLWRVTCCSCCWQQPVAGNLNTSQS